MPAPETIRILLVDDHAMVRESVAHVLHEDAGFEVSHCGSVAEALQILQITQIDLLLVDYDLGSDCASDLLAQLGGTGFTGPTVILTAHVNVPTAKQLVRAGVSGILLKSGSMSVLGAQLVNIRDGHPRFDIDPEPVLECNTPSSERDALTAREKITLDEIVNGLTNKEIAIKHDLSESSVKAHIQRLFLKTGVRTRSHLVRLALEKSLHPVYSSSAGNPLDDCRGGGRGFETRRPHR